MRISTFLFLVATGWTSSALATNEIPVGEVVKGPRAVMDFCTRDPESCEPVAGAAPSLSIDRLQLLNLTVNSSIKDVLDQRSFGKSDHWVVAETVGDCEDIALKKRALLIAKGIDSSKLRIAIVKKKSGPLGAFLTRVSTRRSLGSGYHAVLVVSQPDGDYVLDNLDHRVRLWTKTDYSFEIIQDREDFTTWHKVEPTVPQPLEVAEVAS